VELHLENMSNRGIGRVLQINHQTVVNYLNEQAENIDFKDKTTKYNPVVEIDEMWSFLKDKKGS
jgi:transposase-like protein